MAHGPTLEGILGTTKHLEVQASEATTTTTTTEHAEVARQAGVSKRGVECVDDGEDALAALRPALA